MSFISKAAAFAAGAHQGQRYGAGADYVVHLGAVEAVMRRFGIDDETLLAAAWLHDTLEDTNTSSGALYSAFGQAVLDLVQAVTNEPGANRKERHKLTYPKVRAGGYKAIVLKLADRIANIEASLQDMRGGKLGMYRREYPEFKAALYSIDLSTTQQVDTLRALWAHLDALLQRILVAKPDVAVDYPCCFCWEPTKTWTVTDAGEVQANRASVPCCETCASKHQRTQLPSYDAWTEERKEREALTRIERGPQYLRPATELLDRITKLQQALLPFAQNRSTDQNIDEARRLLGLSPRVR